MIALAGFGQLGTFSLAYYFGGLGAWLSAVGAAYITIALTYYCTSFSNQLTKERDRK
jgi:hypothetical protein